MISDRTWAKQKSESLPQINFPQRWFKMDYIILMTLISALVIFFQVHLVFASYLMPEQAKDITDSSSLPKSYSAANPPLGCNCTNSGSK